MPTARGWLIATAGVALWVTSSALGVTALSQLGFGLIALVVIAAAMVRIGKHDVRITRSLSPERVQSGREIKATLTLENQGRGSAPLLLLEDRIPAELSGRARFAIRGIEPRGKRTTSYSLRPSRRGAYAIGPLEVTVSDPFGVARVTSRAAERSEFLVYPRTEPLALPRDSGTRRSLTTSARRQPTGSQGEDFYTLREYVEGDDLRRINWAATAKRNKYMIRQEETPWHARATILLDDRSEAHSPAGWERAIEVAASTLDLYHRSGYAFRLTHSIAQGVRSSRGSDHLHRCLDLLATIETSPGATRNGVDPFLLRLNELEAQANVEGVLVVVTGTPTLETAQALSRSGKRFKNVVAVMVPKTYFLSGSQRDQVQLAIETSARLLARADIRTLTLKPGESLTAAWAALWKVWGPASTVDGANVGV